VSQFKHTRTEDVIDVPDVLDGRYDALPEYERHVAPEVVGTPEGPDFDPKDPFAFGDEVALANLASIKGTTLDESLLDRGLETSGTADEKRERLAAALETKDVV